jgi:preprotein translocase subunit SecA
MSTKHDIPLIGPILNRIIGSRNDRFVKRYLSRAEAIGKLEPSTRRLTDAQLRAKFVEFRTKRDAGTKAENLMVEAFAVAREAMDRAVGIRNIFNPEKGFDPSTLPAAARALYDQTKAQMDATPPAEPDGEWAGCSAPVPGWQQVDIPPDLYEAVRALYPESRPPFRARPFDVQLIGAMVLSQGKIAEMKTGEGKTIVAPLATYLACIERLKVHVVTVNDYLVQRDRDWTFPFFRALGLTVGAIHPIHMQGEDVKRRMYRCDVVYGTTSEFGFDYLRDNMKRSVEQQVQKARHFAIVDEVDSILIDEARTPLIISGPAHDDKPRYDLADQLARHLVAKQRPWQEADDRAEACKRQIKGLEGDIRNARDASKKPELEARLKAARADLPRLEAEKRKHTQYYETMLERKACHLTHDGIAEAQRVAGVGSFYVGSNMDLPHLLEQSLRAHVVYQRDRDYIVQPAENPNTGRVEPSIIIVDVNTGRPMVGRQWSDGLHQACEAKEGVPIKQENQTVATITIQNFFKMYKRLAGMTGTADTEAQEFHDIYKLDVVAIPTNRAVSRRDFDDLVFLTAKDKWDFIVDEIKAFHDVGRPVLVGTTSVEKSEVLGQLLAKKHGVKHEILNAKQHEREAHIVENAGHLGQVMIATNMAGRGTDIKLGPVTREALLRHWQLRAICPATVTVDSTDEALREGVYRKVAPAELGIPKREAEAMTWPELELRLLRHWAMHHTWLTQGQAEKLDPEGLRKALDTHGRFLLHRIRWFSSIEDMGGLHVVGTERHESRRIDNQLRGRSGRQGDKGSSRFFIGLEDDLMKLFAGETTMKILSRLGMKEGDAIEHPILSKSVERAQRKVEERNFQYRKHILEYDEVMEHQRQAFYGLRQRALEGRDLRGLIFGYIRETVADAVADFLSPDFTARSVAEFAFQKTDTPIAAARLKGLEGAELERRIRQEARDESRAVIAITLGEYLPPTEGDAPAMDFDAPGLMKWARDRFGVELTQADLDTWGGNARRECLDRLAAAADDRIDAVDLGGVHALTGKDFGPKELARWAKSKFDIELDPAAIAKAAGEGNPAVERLIMQQAEALYTKREIEYPVDFILDLTMMLARQSPPQAMQNLVTWANQRFQLGWTMDLVKTTPPLEARRKFNEASKAFVNEGRLEKEVQAAIACASDEALERHLKDRFQIDLPEAMRRLEGTERADAIRSKVESILRAELIYFERTMLLDILDEQWRQHLYSIDQLKDSVGFRAFSQQDPRIEFKREGSRLFNEMMEQVRDRVTDFVFKLKLAPAAPPPPAPMPRPSLAPPTPAPLMAGGIPGAQSGGTPGTPQGQRGGDPYYSPPSSPPREA